MKIILVGSSGAMGRCLAKTAVLRGHEIVAGVDKTKDDGTFPVFERIDDIDIPADIVIDFSHPHLLLPTLEYCKRKSMPLIYGTTGIGEDDDDRIWELSRIVPVVRSNNYSLGISVLKNLLATATKMLSENFDIEIIEKHHKNKIDSPSGTAKMLYDIVEGFSAKELHPVYDRTKRSEKRNDNEVGISSVRGGTIVGEHEIIFAGNDEVITLSHSAYSKEVFANGAIIAAEMILPLDNGYYNMDNIADMIMEANNDNQ